MIISTQVKRNTFLKIPCVSHLSLTLLAGDGAVVKVTSSVHRCISKCNLKENLKEDQFYAEMSVSSLGPSSSQMIQNKVEMCADVSQSHLIMDFLELSYTTTQAVNTLSTALFN